LTKFKNKKLVRKNGVTVYLSTSNLSFEKLSKELQNVEVNIFNSNRQYTEKEITPHKVYSWAHGSIPKAKEMKSLAYLKYKDSSRWLDLYIPSSQTALYILKDITTQIISKAFNKTDRLKRQFTKLNYIKALEILENTKSSQINMAIALTYLGWKHYIAELSRISSKKAPIFSEESKEVILDSIYHIIDTIVPSSNFITEVTAKLRVSLTLDDFDNGMVTRKLKKILLHTILKLFE
jgi:hypothetical protein